MVLMEDIATNSPILFSVVGPVSLDLGLGAATRFEDLLLTVFFEKEEDIKYAIRLLESMIDGSVCSFI